MISNDIDKMLLLTKPFKYLDSKELNIIKPYCNSIQFKEGNIIIVQGKKSNAMYIILTGEALVLIKLLGEESIDLSMLERGNFFGEVSLIQKMPTTATVIAKTELNCLQLTTEYFDILEKNFPDIRYKITKAITDEVYIRLKDLHRRITTLLNTMIMTTPSSFIQEESMIYETTLNDIHLDRNNLKEVPFFKKFDDAELNALIHHAKILEVNRYQTLIKENDDQNVLYIILRGAVQLSIIVENNISKLLVLSPVTLFGNMALINQTASLFNYRTCEHVVLLKINQEQLKIIQDKHLTLWEKLFNHLCESFIDMERAANKLLIRLNSESYNR
jgi:CRP/FNR family transcriptional regulator, cyclic AMP receptor protein